MTQSCWRPQFLIYFRLPRAQADGKWQEAEEKARVEKLGPENNAWREPNRSTCSLGESLLDPLGLNTWSQGPRFVCYAMLVDLRILGEVAGLTGPTISTKIAKFQASCSSLRPLLKIVVFEPFLHPKRGVPLEVHRCSLFCMVCGSPSLLRVLVLRGKYLGQSLMHVLVKTS